jgi:hypothetical protein
LATVKFAGTEWVLQEPTAQPPAIAKRATVPVIGPDGFLTADSLRTLVSQSGLLPEREEPEKELLIFQTPKQRTWLLATDNFVFILLDDEGTRSKNNVIQTYFEKKKTLPLSFGLEKQQGLVKFAAEDTWWYYSLQLFDKTASLLDAVQRLIT